MRRLSQSRRRKGVGATELAVILPVLVLLALGCVDLGRFLYHYIAVTNAARAGAEYATMNPYTPSGQGTWLGMIQTTARNELTGQTACDPNDLTTTTTVTVESPSGLRRVRVEATYATFDTLVDWPGLPGTLTLRSAVVMRSIR